jgi:hypothetical protein
MKHLEKISEKVQSNAFFSKKKLFYKFRLVYILFSMAFSSSTQSSIDLLNSQSTFKNYLLSQDGDGNSSLSFSSSSSKSTDRQIRKQRNELRSVRENEKLLQEYENKLNKIYKKKPNQREKNSRKKSIPIK